MTVPVASSSGLMGRVPAESSDSDVADVATATGTAPPPGAATHPATVARPTTAAPSASVRDNRGRGRITRRTATRRASWLDRPESTVIDSTSDATTAKRRAQVHPNEIMLSQHPDARRAATVSRSPPVVSALEGGPVRRPSWSPSRPAPLVSVGKVGNGPPPAGTRLTTDGYRWALWTVLRTFCGLGQSGPGGCEGTHGGPSREAGVWRIRSPTWLAVAKVAIIRSGLSGRSS